MTSNNFNHETIQVLIPTPFEDFNSWFVSVIDEINPSLIVGIARGAVRLLQLQNATGFLPDISIISDHALPFIPDSDLKKHRILLFDDSVVFGSTLSNIRDYLMGRGAVVFCASYIVDRVSFLGEPDIENKIYPIPPKFRDIPVRAKHLLWPNVIRRHHNLLVNYLLRVPRDYNLDFPAFCLKIPEYCANDIPYILYLLRQAGIVRESLDISSTVSVENGIYRYTLLLEPIFSDLFSKGNLYCRAYSKVRITFVPESQAIRFTPMPQLGMADSITFDDIRFKHRTINRLWKKMHPPQNKDDVFYKQAIFRLSTMFTAILLGEVLIREFITSLKSDYPVKQIELITEDIKATLGECNSKSLQEIWSYLHQMDALPCPDMNQVDSYLDMVECLNEELIRKIITEWQSKPWLKPHPGEWAYEALGKVFLSLRAVTDSKECRTNNPYASRLEVGLSYEGIRHLLFDECRIDLTPDEISRTLDMCIDNGQAVPKVIQQESVWLRAFYSGEAEDAHKLLQTKDAIYKAYSELLQQKTVHPLTQFDMHKLCSTLKELLPWLPISTKFNTFGRFARVGKSDTEIIAWLINQGNGPLHLVTENKRKVLKINESYTSCVEPSWDLRESRDFYDAFQFIATAFSNCEDEAKLLLSTCPTHIHTYNAVAFEAHSWVHHERGDFQKLLGNIKLITDNSIKDADKATTSIYWCTRFITEALKKYDLFHRRFETLKKQLEQAFASQGLPAKRFWQLAIAERGLLDPVLQTECEMRFRYLMPIINQMSKLTAFVTRLLMDLDLITETSLQERFEDEGTSLKHKEFRWLTKSDCRVSASNYNTEIKQQKIAGISIEKTLLPLDIPSKDYKIASDWYREAQEIVQQCFREIQTSLWEFCPEIEVPEGSFPYLSDSSKRVLSDGSIERRVSDIYVLTMDIIGSTNSEQTNQLKDYILNTFKRFQSKGVYSEKTGNDAYVACCVDITVLWDIATSIMLYGESLKVKGERLSGTRKALSYGTVSVREDTNGSMVIRDARIPNLLPQVFYILDGIDTYCEKNPDIRNSMIVIEEKTTELLIPILRLNSDDRKPVPIKNKHFDGKCYCFDLQKFKG